MLTTIFLFIVAIVLAMILLNGISYLFGYKRGCFVDVLMWIALFFVFVLVIFKILV